MADKSGPPRPDDPPHALNNPANKNKRYRIAPTLLDHRPGGGIAGIRDLRRIRFQIARANIALVRLPVDLDHAVYAAIGILHPLPLVIGAGFLIITAQIIGAPAKCHIRLRGRPDLDRSQARRPAIQNLRCNHRRARVSPAAPACRQAQKSGHEKESPLHGLIVPRPAPTCTLQLIPALAKTGGMSKDHIHIIGGGLAGSEAAWQCANAGVPVILHEMRPVRGTDAHKTDGLAELVCSNSFRSDDAEYNAVGVLHEEMRRANSLIMREGDKAAVPAGGALAVDRDIFSQGVTGALEKHPLITIERGEIETPPDDWASVIIATGPLTSPALAQTIQTLGGEEQLAFFDAIAPIIHKDSIDFDTVWLQSRYDKGEGSDYINCPMDAAQYEAFIAALLAADKTEFKEWEKNTPYFEGCMPIEVMASRGIDTLRFGPMKPVGLSDPKTGKRPHAVVQLRQDNALGTLYNMVGFQTKMKYGAQTEVFRMIPGLENAEFARLGGLHRNTFINAPRLLDHILRMKARPAWRFAGQITGCEGYVESAAVGLMAGRFAAAEILDQTVTPPPATTAMGAILSHITGGADAQTFQPMNVNFGLFPPLDDESGAMKGIKGKEKGRARKKLLARRALNDCDHWLATQLKQAA